MKIERKQSNDERQILTAMIVSNQALGRIANKYEEKMFASTWANLIASWCVKFYGKYGTAPKREIHSVYERWAERSEDKSTVDIVTKFLDSLSREHGDNEVNVEYIIDQASSYFNKVKIQRLKEQLDEELENGNVEKAEEVLKEHRRVEFSKEGPSNAYQELDLHKHKESQMERLIEYPGALKKFFANRLCRDAFIVFQAPAKRKKSFWLLDVAHRAIKQRLNVLYIVVADMSEDQVTRRIQARLCGRPVKRGKYQYPVKLISGTTQPKVVHRTKREKRSLTLGDIVLAQKRFHRLYLRSDHKFFKMWCSPSMSVADIRSRIQRLQEYDNWTPDVIVLDYIDRLDYVSHIHEKRDQILHNWQQMRALNLELHCLLVTATQANAKAHKAKIQDRSSWSDNQLKMAEVTGLIGINQFGPYQERKQLMRLNWILVREGEPYRSVWTAACLSNANPAVLSI